jgi:hypothetical protein
MAVRLAWLATAASATAVATAEPYEVSLELNCFTRFKTYGDQAADGAHDFVRVLMLDSIEARSQSIGATRSVLASV